eukprot:CAMPEP_0202978080 /NCGR_PEP_ID=MMETSP1396-20130829/84631_1 /ASSEMBLY_ACC=CAM_ASM_000872 /TAXON_ID= /ORGANISM="Pseudokeronopsis sp., Strain Brazil" /LENGTH=144 /DNA_ID=CAMNT_0049716949 /DNA_START=232 /DNA_END=666 /DNA_ORIENTATION=+
MISPCTVTLIPNDTLTNPKVYYKLENFYANHRSFVKSRNYKQLKGNIIEESNMGSCDPITNMSMIGDEELWVTFDGSHNLSAKTAANPCGLIAKYIFTDSFTLVGPDGNNIVINEKDIAHEVDKKYKFKNPENATEIQWHSTED